MTVFSWFLRDRRKSAMWWGLGLAGLAIFTTAFYPSIKGQQDLDDVVKDLPAAVRAMFGFEEGVSLSSAPGYLQARLFSSLYTILLVVLGIAAGAGAIGGSEEDGGLELLLSNPIGRGRVLLERAAGAAAIVAIEVVAFTAVLLPCCGVFGAFDGVSVPGLLTASVGAGTLALLHAAIAFTIGAWTGRRGPAIGIASAVAGAGYLAQGVLVAADVPTAVRCLSPWFWYLRENLLLRGPNLSSWLPELVASVFVVAAAWPKFRVRDLR